MGQVYVEISASVVNEMMGISTLTGSGAGGSETVSLTINWNDGGFTEQGWFFAETPLPNWWSKVCSGGSEEVSGTYDSNEAGFVNWIRTERPDNLNDALGGWTNDAKIAFLINHPEVYDNCILP